jgi:preprotein translocase subunit SecA
MKTSTAEDLAGLTVLQWGVTPSERVAKQLRGRAGRQGDPGQTFAVASILDASTRRHYPRFGEVQKTYSSWCVPKISSESHSDAIFTHSHRFSHFEEYWFFVADTGQGRHCVRLSTPSPSL